MDQNSNNQNQLITKKCPMCGKEYPKKQAICPKCDVILVREKDYEQLKITKNLNIIPNDNKVTCPYCHSTDVSKISTLGRAASVGVFGLASKKIGKQWHCNHCKSDF